jgi:hypothetical protein
MGVHDEMWREEIQLINTNQRYRDLMDKFPPSVQNIIVEKYGDRHTMKKKSLEELQAICDKLKAALEVEEERLYNVYKDLV